MLASIYAKIASLVDETWQDDMRQFGDEVALYRDYEAGDHRAKMTGEMREMLRISDAKTEHFNDNYCELVVSKFVNRLQVTRIEGESDQATEWAQEVMRLNRFDALQYDVHEATIRDGDTFVMLDYDNDHKMVRFHHEPAWDGEIGMMVVYDRMVRNIVLAIKVWHEASERRVNFYYDDRIEKYRYGDDLGGGMQLIETVDYTVNGEPLGVPVVHFRNKAKSRRVRGRSELKAAVPMQDALNRTIVSMVTTSELSSFGLRYAIGFDPPSKLAPGSWVVVGEAGNDERVELGTMDQAQLVPFISQAQFLIEQIATVSATPLMSMMGSNDSGEALKQRENDLIGKVESFQVKNGNIWEDAFTYAQVLQRAFGTTMPPETGIWSCKWRPAELRDDAQVITNAKLVRDEVSHREFLRLIAPAFDYDEQKIERIVSERISEQTESVNALQGVLPGFDQFVNPSTARSTLPS